jgi:hypothetical protein
MMGSAEAAECMTLETGSRHSILGKDRRPPRPFARVFPVIWYQYQRKTLSLPLLCPAYIVQVLEFFMGRQLEQEGIVIAHIAVKEVSSVRLIITKSRASLPQSQVI